MKDLINYISILESSKYFTLDDGERDALGTLIGVLCGSLGDKEDEEELKPVKNELSTDEINQLSDLFDFLDNTETYKKVNRNNIKDNIPLIKKIYNVMVEKDLLGENWDLIDALEKISNK